MWRRGEEGEARDQRQDVLGYMYVCACVRAPSGAGPVDENSLRDNPNDVSSQWRAGYLLYSFNSDEKEARRRECVERAARSDTVVGQVAQAFCMVKGWERGRDKPGAVRLLGELVATTASPDAQHLLGVCYDEGWGVQKNEAEAVRLWALAAEQGHALAQYELGYCYFYGKRGLQQDLVKARQLYQQAAAQGHTQAIGMLAAMK